MKTQGLIAAGIASALLTTPLAVLADDEGNPPPEHSVSANIGVVSNYIWRGITQTDDKAAVQGGLDYSHSSGFYAGTWVSNVDFNLDEDSPSAEVDLYLGYTNSIIEDLTYNVKGIYYAYPGGKDLNFAEVGGSLGYKWFKLGVDYTVYGENEGGLYDQGDWYFSGAFTYDELPYGLSFSLRAGYTDYKNSDITFVETLNDVDIERSANADYWNYGASISKTAGEFGTFSLNWDQNNGEENVGFNNDPKFWVGWLKTF